MCVDEHISSEGTLYLSNIVSNCYLILLPHKLGRAEVTIPGFACGETRSRNLSIAPQVTQQVVLLKHCHGASPHSVAMVSDSCGVTDLEADGPGPLCDTDYDLTVRP